MFTIRRAVALAVALAALALAPAATAAVPGNYSISVQNGTTFGLQTSKLIIPATGATDDTLTYLSTTTSGARHLPFPITFYGHSYNRLAVSSNGNIQFGVASPGGNAQFSNESLPSANFSAPTLYAFWDDLFFVPSDTSHAFNEGIFAHTSGTGTHHTFVISWQGHAFNNEAYLVLAQARFHQGSQTIQLRYGRPDNQGTFAPSETIGSQFAPTGTHFTQVTFNPPPPGVVTVGKQYTLTHH